MEIQDIATKRLYSQQLSRTNLHQPVDVVSWLGAVQAQDYSGAKWSLGLRLPPITDPGIEQDITDKAIFRTWLLRGTLHFVSAGDIHWMLALVAGRIISGNKRRYLELELDEKTLMRSNDLLSKALQGANQMDRKSLLAVLENEGISTKGQRGVYMLQRASLDGLICQGTMYAKIPGFTRLEKVPSKSIHRDEAIAKLASRYFTSRGPATLQDYTWWSGLSAAEAKAGLDSIKSHFIHETMADQTYWFSPLRQLENDPAQSILLLPGFDEYLLSYKDRSASLDVPNYNRLIPTNGMLPATIVINGRVVGTWKRTFKKGAVYIVLSPFNPLSTAEYNGATTAASRLGDFLGMPAILI